MRLQAIQRTTIGDIIEDASSAAEAAADGRAVKLPAGVRLAKVTTHDPPPLGDLAIHTSPDASSPQIPGGGASKDGIVAVIVAGESGAFSNVVWPGDSHRQGGVGFAHTSALAFLPAGDPNAKPGAPGAGPDGDDFPVMTVAAIGVGVLALGGLAWYALR